MSCCPGGSRVARARGGMLASCRTASPTRPARTCCSTRTTRSTGGSGRRRRSPRPSAAACRCCSPSATPPATGATSWRTSRSRTTTTAAYMNEHFVNVKVDREERPDVDAVYMEAVQAMTGHGGWPMTSFLTAKGEPFFCGTYWPLERRQGMPSFREVLQSVAADLGDPARRGRGRRRRRRRSGCPARRRRPRAAVTPELLDRGGRACAASYDGVHGGFGGAPKFPPSMVLEFLLRHAARTGRGARAGRAHLPGDGPRRDVRPARRRLRALLGRRAVGRAALREDAVRQRAAAAGLRAPVARHRLAGRPAGRARDRRLPAARPAHRARAASPRRSTPTPTARRG